MSMTIRSRILAVLVFAPFFAAQAASYTYEHRKLPAGYKGVTYVKSGSTSYVDLDILASASTGWAMDTVMANWSTPAARAFCGSGTKVKYAKTGITLLQFRNNSGGGWGYVYGSGVDTFVMMSGSDYYKVECELRPGYQHLKVVDEFDVAQVDYQPEKPDDAVYGEDVSFFLFSDNPTAYGDAAPWTSVCYFLKLYMVAADGTRTLVRDLEPCVRESDSEPGLWDFASERFFCSAGSGKLTAGADLPRDRYVSKTGEWTLPGEEGEPRYTTIAAALADVNPTETIWLQDGFVDEESLMTFTENKNQRRVRAVVDKDDITIRSESGYVDEANGKGASIRGLGFEVQGDVTNWENAVSCVYVSGKRFLLKGVILESGATSQVDKPCGGGLFLYSTATQRIESCVIRNCASAYRGGGAYAGSETPAFHDCVISNNLALNEGGGACGGCYYDSRIIGNSAVYRGGGVMNGNTEVHVFSNCTISCNKVTIPSAGSADGHGGGVCLYGSSAGYVKGDFRDCIITNNSVPNNGGGIFAAGRVENCLLAGNRAGRGGGISGRTNVGADYVGVWDTYVKVIGCTIRDNFAKNGGGCNHAMLTNCLIVGNSTKEASVGSYLGGAGASGCDLANCVVSNNTSTSYYQQGSAAGIHSDDSDSHLIVNTLIVGNTDRGSGVGGVKGNEKTVLVNCTVTGNACTREVGSKNPGSGGVNKVILINSIDCGNDSKTADTVSAATNSCATILADTTKYPGCITDDPKLDARYAPHRKSCRNSALLFDWMTDPNDIRSKDVYGAARVQGKGPDMGAVETPDYGLIILMR